MELHEQVKQQTQALKVAIEGMEELRYYLSLPKFKDNIMVNKNDILMRLNEIDSNLFN